VTTCNNPGAFVALAGTGVLGEGARLFAPNSDRFFKKEKMLNAYNLMNEEVANGLKIPYRCEESFLGEDSFLSIVL
jgi:hypothetical protein